MAVTKKPYHHGDLRRAMIESAYKRARQSGEKAIVIREIAAEIGVSATAAYRHFQDRADLVGAVAATGFIDMGSSMMVPPVTDGGEVPTGDRASLAAYADIRNAVIGMATFAHTDRTLCRFMVESWAEFKLADLGSLAMAGDSLPAPLVEPMQRGIEAGMFSEETSLFSDLVFWAAVQGVTTTTAFEIYPPQSLEDMLTNVARPMFDFSVQHLLTDWGRTVMAELGTGPDRRISDLTEWVPADHVLPARVAAVVS